MPVSLGEALEKAGMDGRAPRRGFAYDEGSLLRAFMTEFNPYEAPTAAVEDRSYAPTYESELADRGTRLAAKMLDGLIFGGALIVPIIILIAAIATRERSHSGTAFLIAGIALTAAVALGMLGWNLVWLHRYGQTIAKRICKVRIVRGDGDRASLGRLVGLRFCLPWVIGWIPFLGPLFGITDICFIFREDRRCLHDLIADTMVVKA
jgi:uncharacterized RDD family membrane protein YckC